MTTAVRDGSPTTVSTAPRSTDDPIEPAIRPRRSLPNGRAVTGALLVTVAAVGAFTVARGRESTPDTSYLVTAHPIAAGDVVAGSDFTVVPIELPAAVRATAAGPAIDIESAVALRDLRAGELLSADDLLPSADTGSERLTGTHELTLPIPRERAGQSLVPGDRVTILATLILAREASTVVAVEDAVVVDWRSGNDGVGAAGTGIITLALPDPATVMELAHLANRGDVTVVRTTRAIADPYPDSYPDPYPDSYPDPYPSDTAGSDDWQAPIDGDGAVTAP